MKVTTNRRASRQVAHSSAPQFERYIGIDHGFSFPMAYFKRHGLRHDWPAPSPRRTADQHDAWVVAEWMRTADANGALASALRPAMDIDDRTLAEIEGWILAVG